MRLAGPLLIVLLAAALRLHDLPGLWVDEAFSVNIAREGVGEAYARMFRDYHPPLWHMGLALHVAAFGESELAVRLPSIAGGTLTVLLLCAIAGGWFPPGRRWLPPLLLAVQAGHLHYSREARAYAVLELLTTLGAWIAVECFARREAPPRRVAAWALVSTLVCWTHFLSFVVVFAQGLVLLAAAARSGEARRAVPRVVAAGTLTVLACVPLLLSFARNAKGGVWYMSRPHPLDLALLPADLLWKHSRAAGDLLFGLGLGFLVWSLTAWVAGRTLWKRGAQEPHDARFLAWTALWVAPACAIFAISYLRTPAWNLRQTLNVQTPLILSIAWIASGGAAEPMRPLRRLAVAALVLCALGPLRAWTDHAKDADRRLAAFLCERVPPGGAVFVWPYYEIEVLWYYMRHPPVPVREPRPEILGSHGRAQDLAACSPGRECWLVWYRMMREENGKTWDAAPPGAPEYARDDIEVYRLTAGAGR